MDYDIAKKAVEAAIKKAEDMGVAVSVAIVDSHGSLMAFGRMKDAIKISPRFSQAKAYTAATVGMATGDMAGYAVEGKPYFGLNSILGGDLTTIAGGLPIKKGEELVGGIGVGGSADVNQDVEIAKAGLEGLV